MSFRNTRVRNTKLGVETQVSRVDDRVFDTVLETESGHEIILNKSLRNPPETDDWEWFCEHEGSPVDQTWCSFGQ